MSKVGLIIKREYLSRVTKRSFLLATFLTPLAIGLFGLIAGKIMTYRDDKKDTIAVVDNSGFLKDKVKESKVLNIVFTTEPLENIKQKVLKKELDYAGVLVVPPIQDLKSNRHNTTFYTDRRLTPELTSDIKDVLSDAIRDYKIDAFKLDTSQVTALRTSVSIEPEPLDPKSEKKSTSKTVAITAIISILMGFVMYLAIFIYGSMIMRSVMEEKTNRIVEVMISSVKPHQLMLGKIIGVGLVGLTQMILWVVLLFAITIGLNLAFGTDPAQLQQMQQMQQMSNVNPAVAQMQQDPSMSVNTVLSELGRMNWWFIIPCFLFYFLAGYLLYASLFAAVGSAVGDDLGEAQSLTLPISMPVIFAIYIAMSTVQNPDSGLAVFGSFFPLFSPIVMPARLASDPSVWQVLLSMGILAITTYALVMLSARIYRVGILMYGKKASFKELGKWIFYKE
jgi:ABC-2 type transport system permease protein